MKNELYKHKRSDKVKWTLTAIMFVLFAVLMAGVCLQVFTKSDKLKPSEWFKKTDKPQAEQTAPETDSNVKTFTREAKMSEAETLPSEIASFGTDVTSQYKNKITLKNDKTGQTTNKDVYVILINGMNYTIFVPKKSPFQGWSTVSITTTDTSSGKNIDVLHSMNATENYGSRSLLSPPSANIEILYTVTPAAPEIYSCLLPVYDSRLSEIDPDADDYSDLGEEFAEWAYDDFEKLYYLGTLTFSGTQTVAQGSLAGIQTWGYKWSNLVADTGEYVAQQYTNFQLDSRFAFGYESYFQDSAFRASENEAIFSFATSFIIQSLEQRCQMVESAGFRIFCDYVRAEIPLPDDPVKEGYNFVGWYYGTEDEHGENCTAYDRAPIYEDTNLHAHWAIKTYKVTLNSAGGSNQEAITVNWNTAATLPTSNRIGYDFLGWYLPDGTEYTNQPIKEDTTLTAKWKIKTFKVTFYVNGEKYAEKTVEYGSQFTQIAEAATAENLQIMSVSASSGVPVINLSDITVTEDYDVQAEVMTGADKVKNTVKNNWLTIVLSAGGLIAVICLVSALCSRKKKRYRE